MEGAISFIFALFLAIPLFSREYTNIPYENLLVALNEVSVDPDETVKVVRYC